MINPLNIIMGWFYRITHRNNKLYKARIEHCNKCKKRVQLTKNVYFCSECWCELGAKTRVIDEKCPLNKW